jgi:hypothetical protein
MEDERRVGCKWRGRIYTAWAHMEPLRQILSYSMFDIYEVAILGAPMQEDSLQEGDAPLLQEDRLQEESPLLAQEQDLLLVQEDDIILVQGEDRLVQNMYFPLVQEDVLDTQLLINVQFVK